ncbi:heavy-metal-associated domain-containing protein [Allosphingosinicella indica]|uniref:Heavy-metal-associated domain-containing protein n=1 Tax=Allosphingosinicella indica TaxID=941907 RepID=A0A1X7H3G7_9SPHN|nr:heavy-metal-associated domain-containing protein [Allosphingosinicella indica]SMF78908.1 hypothetical protein SAMN06295910_2777 [Allosphingosinicella indica]
MTRLSRPLLVSLLLVALAFVGVRAVEAQLEGADRGVPPVDSASTLEVTGVEVDTSGKSSEEARLAGWREAQSKGFKALWARTTGRPLSEAPTLPGSTLDGLVTGIVIEEEQIGPTRYVARLGVLFDRGRAGEMLGVGGIVRRSAPMLTIPVMLTGSTLQSFESRTEWQRAWARFRTGGSAIDYVRPTGAGVDPLLLNAAETHRPGRTWWRMLLDQYGASGVVIPEVQLLRSYPGGPAIGNFVARFGPDGVVLDRFTLRAASSAAIPRMMDEGVRRLDAAYTRALNAGFLKVDSTLLGGNPDPAAALAAQIEAANAAAEAAAAPPPLVQSTAPVPVGAATSFTIQVTTPNAAAVSQAELSVSRVPGVTSAITTSLALGGTSVMRVTYAGEGAALAAALQSQGWNVSGSGSTLTISRPGQ